MLRHLLNRSTLMIGHSWRRCCQAMSSSPFATTTGTTSSMPHASLDDGFGLNSGAKFTTPALEDMPFVHHGTRPRHRDYVKFKSPRKRASKLYHELVTEAVEKSKKGNPAVWDVPFAVGDAIEIGMINEGGIHSENIEKIRGVVIGIYRKDLDTSVSIRDVVYGEPIERKVPLHCPHVKWLKVLETNFVYKGKRRVKRAKLYFLRDRNPITYTVSKN